LADSSNLAIFELKSVRLAIEYTWPHARAATIKKLLVPFLFYLLLFWVYNNFVDELKDLPQVSALGYTVWFINLCLLVGFSGYFIRNEVRQILYQGWKYMLEAWNYIDLVPPVIVLLITFVNMSGIETSWEKTAKSIGSLAMWLKLLYFFRVNKSTGYLIRMIAKVVYGMRTFLMVLAITILAVADSFISIA
jgi:hypothetical protein